MRYMGSKSRIAKDILPIILKDRKEGQYYVEPFVGGANMIDKVDGNRIGADSNKYLISFYNSIFCGWLPPKNITKEEYIYIKNHKDENEPLTFWAGVCCSFGCKWFGGFLSDYQESKRLKSGILPNHQREAYNNLLKQLPNLTGIKFLCSDYLNLEIPDNSIIYCDPPYQNTIGYKDDFNHEYFWEWCRIMVELGHKVFISEYNAPEDFICIWEKDISNTISKQLNKIATEKLFIHKSQL